VKAPQELHAFHFLMAWHPTRNTDARHGFLGSLRQRVNELLAKRNLK
jgi:hypothetical protein